MKKKYKKKKKYNKRLSTFIFILLLILALFLNKEYKKYEEEKRQKEFEESFITNKIDLTNYAIYGTHLWLEGTSKVEGDLILTDTNKEQKIMHINKTFKTNINDGIDLEKINKKQYLLLRSEDKLYSITNKSNNKNLTYYTLTKNKLNHKVKIKWDKTLTLNKTLIKPNKNIYDIVIDPGHGNIDIGASTKLNGKTYTEADLNLKIAKLLKKDLENYGYEVKLTRNKKEDINTYGKNSRTSIPYETKAKLTISIHNNSYEEKLNNLYGYEIYVSNDNNLILAEQINKNLKKVSTPSTSKENKLEEGIYQRLFTKEEINKEKNKYNLTTNTPYYYMIREIGGISTNATNKQIDGKYQNKYYNNKISSESLLLELSYINNDKDLQNLINKKEDYALQIAKAINTYYRGEEN